jgi:hypothetical protein
VPIYIASEDYIRDEGKASQPERAALERMLVEAWRLRSGKVFLASDATCFVLDYNTGACVGAIRLPDLMEVPKVLELLNTEAQKLNVTAGQTVVPPSEQVRPERMVKPDELSLHLVARHIPAGGTWKQLPAEDYIILTPEQWRTFLPPQPAKVGDTYEIDEQVNEKILSNLYPPTPNRDPETNKIESPPMKATVVSVKDGMARVRLDNDFRMKHHFLPVKLDDREVKATLVGFVDVDLKNQKIKKFQMVTEQATYDDGKFGAAIRSVDPRLQAAAPAEREKGSAQPLPGWSNGQGLMVAAVAVGLVIAIVASILIATAADRRRGTVG